MLPGLYAPQCETCAPAELAPSTDCSTTPQRVVHPVDDDLAKQLGGVSLRAVARSETASIRKLPTGCF